MRVLPMLTLCILIKACFAQKNDRLIPLTSVDIGFFSAAVTHAPVLGKHVVADVTAGIGPGYDVAEASHVIKFLPAAFFSVTPKYYFNREKRATKGLDLKFNSGNFLGARVKYSLPLITQKMMKSGIRF
jgi:hypothetical protein